MENVLSVCKEAIPYFYDEICHPNKILTVIAFISISLLLICSKSTANNGDDQCELLQRPSYIFLLNRPHLRSPHKYDVLTYDHLTVSFSTVTFHVSCRLEKDTQSAHPNNDNMKTKTFEAFEELQVIFESATARGNNAFGLGVRQITATISVNFYNVRHIFSCSTVLTSVLLTSMVLSPTRCPHLRPPDRFFLNRHAHPNNDNMKTKTFEAFEELQVIFESATARGNNAFGLGGDATAEAFENLMENVLSVCKEAIPYFYDEICHPNKILTVIAFISISLLLICSKSTANNGDDQCELLQRPSYIFLLNRPHLRSPHKYGIITNEMSSPTTT
ncbi:hypothetical protein YC2023_059830 [Brassica napus]